MATKRHHPRNLLSWIARETPMHPWMLIRPRIEIAFTPSGVGPQEVSDHAARWLDLLAGSRIALQTGSPSAVSEVSRSPERLL
jgi:hypothetical protein